MKFYTLFLIGSYLLLKQRNKNQTGIANLNFGYGINYKYEGMLTHSFNRFYVVTKFMLPSIKDIKFSRLNFDHTCAYMNKEYAPNTDSRKYLTKLKTYCNKIKPFVSY